MSSPFCYDATAENFDALVLGNSRRGPVAVYFWSPRAAPCMMLMPRLLRLVQDYGGRFLLVRVNTDVLARLARAWGVTSLPTVKFFRDGAVIRTVHGVESGAGLRAAVDACLAAAGKPRKAAEALRLFGAGEHERAYAALAQAALDDPDDVRLPLDLARLMVQNAEYRRAFELLESLPAPMRGAAEVERLRIHLALVLESETAPGLSALDAQLEAQPEDLDACFKRAARHLMADAYGPAFEDLLRIARLDPGWRDGLPRKALAILLELPGLDERLRAIYRQKLAEVPGG